jgi:hypothetical protein
LLGTTNTINTLGCQVLVGKSVPRRNLMNIITFDSFLVIGACLASPAQAGALVAVANEG